MDQSVRWKQRFENFEKAFKRLQDVIDLSELNELERNGLIQRFEFTVELAWKTLKDFLNAEGFDIKSHKETIRQAFQSSYISDGKIWIRILDARNKLSHDYNGEYFEAAEEEIRHDFFPAIEMLYMFFVKQHSNNQLDLL